MDKTSNKNKKVAKRNSEARREQNRQASRNYREKRKQKLALLNQLLDSDAPNEAAEPVNGSPGEGVVSRIVPTSEPALNNGVAAGEAVPPLPGTIDETFLRDTWGDIPDTSTFAFDSNNPYQTSFLGPYSTTGVDMGLDAMSAWRSELLNPLQPALYPTTMMPGTQMTLSPLGQLVSNPLLTQRESSFLGILEGIDNLSIHQKRALLRRLQQQTQDTTSQAHPFSSPQVMSSQSATKLQLEAQHFAQALHRTAAGWIGPSPMPSQYVMEAGFFGALFANCYALGMGSVDALLVEDGWSVFSLAPQMGYHPSQLSVVRAKFRTLAPDLRPVDVQLTVAHHPYIDLIPYKSFRENTLKALEHDPPLLDEDELCQDLVAGGMICWGSKQNSLGMDAAVPWDSRSWEPKVWFLKKYPHLVGGWDGEMWKGTRWWHSMRGERIQELE
ncbi:Fc.00g061750.m01.CDS01 [Cosmosporella sp. VM-42]